MKNTKNQMMNEELKRFHCSILMDEVREKVRKLKEYGVEASEIMAAIEEEISLPRLIVTKDYQIVLSGEQKIEIKMEPLVKAVFLLFLKHPEGIVFKHLPDYREELIEIYKKFRPLGLNERSFKSIEDVTDPTLNSINEKCARIREAFNKKIDDEIIQYYAITGKRGEAKKIMLDRSLVVWETE